jgi:hypothetical protein
MTLVPDFGLGVAVLTNLSPPNGVTEILTRYIVDRLRGRDPGDLHLGQKLLSPLAVSRCSRLFTCQEPHSLCLAANSSQSRGSVLVKA